MAWDRVGLCKSGGQPGWPHMFLVWGVKTVRSKENLYLHVWKLQPGGWDLWGTVVFSRNILRWVAKAVFFPPWCRWLLCFCIAIWPPVWGLHPKPFGMFHGHDGDLGTPHFHGVVHVKCSAIKMQTHHPLCKKGKGSMWGFAKQHFNFQHAQRPSPGVIQARASYHTSLAM